jgi:hypothetical protein
VRAGKVGVISISHECNIAFASAACLVSIPSSLSHSSLSFLSPLFSSIMPRWNRTMVLATSFIGALFNSILAIQLFALWRSLRRDSESEWEGSLDPWTVNTISLLGGLSAAYFVTAAVASAIGFAGIVKVGGSLYLSNPSFLGAKLSVSGRVICRAFQPTYGFIAISQSQTLPSAPSLQSL